jgi:hypothetical protein
MPLSFPRPPPLTCFRVRWLGWYTETPDIHQLSGRRLNVSGCLPDWCSILRCPSTCDASICFVQSAWSI